MALLKRFPWLVLLQTMLVVGALGQKQKPASPDQTEPVRMEQRYSHFVLTIVAGTASRVCHRAIIW